MQKSAAATDVAIYLTGEPGDIYITREKNFLRGYAAERNWTVKCEFEDRLQNDFAYFLVKGE